MRSCSSPTTGRPVTLIPSIVTSSTGGAHSCHIDRARKASSVPPVTATKTNEIRSPVTRARTRSVTRSSRTNRTRASTATTVRLIRNDQMYSAPLIPSADHAVPDPSPPRVSTSPVGTRATKTA